LHPTFYWYDVVLLAAVIFWPLSITALLALAWLGWRQRRHWAGLLLLAGSLAGAAIVIWATIDSA
jgi:hypothetical protein